MLWSRLRRRLPDQPVFRRQHPMGPYILDFYCPAAKLAVEVDGSTHWDDEQIAHDERQDAWRARREFESSGSALRLCSKTSTAWPMGRGCRPWKSCEVAPDVTSHAKRGRGTTRRRASGGGGELKR
ncbi:DUF559 domain-containing protein [Phenylobacterium sp.]|uniref:endonuclease domain-containing protein n=1 Tax=Phenylobacterium sp. TaxID=1871053 RepID=UPI00263913B3|nr:DUF559 domain-containing protein [Phenylobacterium sp.]